MREAGGDRGRSRTVTRLPPRPQLILQVALELQWLFRAIQDPGKKAGLLNILSGFGLVSGRGHNLEMATSFLPKAIPGGAAVTITANTQDNWRNLRLGGIWVTHQPLLSNPGNRTSAHPTFRIVHFTTRVFPIFSKQCRTF